MQGQVDKVAGNSSKSSTAEEGIAVVGIGCRLPGKSDDVEAFWKLLMEGRDAVREVSPDRWSAEGFFDKDPTRPGHMLTKRGGYLEDVVGFDAAFFGITPREAARIDPQQRLFLETTWEALQDAGIAPEALAGTNTAVYVGVSGHDYGILQLNPQNRDLLGGHTMAGVTNCVVANRVSYLLDLHGPSMIVDTACSSSLVAIHLACKAIRAGEADIAIAGGVQTLLSPETTIAFSQGTFLSPDGRCKSFDARANGYVRSEGSGTVILKPLSKALADGDSIYAVIRGSATNQDGRTNGISVPSEDAQCAMVIDACRDAGIAPGEIQYVEAHGTGTPVGDPIEARALGRALAVGRNGAGPCIVGAVKSNIGHLESAAGIAGLIKACLVTKHGRIPRNLNMETPNPEIPFDRMPLQLALEEQAWPENGTRYAGVNSFGFGGSNAHVVLERPPMAEARERYLPRREQLFTLSAKTPEALSAYARRYAEYLGGAGDEAAWYDIAAGQAKLRSHYDHRLAFAAESKEQARALLDDFAAGGMPKGVQSGMKDASLAQAPIVFVFSGQGPQWFAMGRELLVHNEVFRRTVERVHTELSKYADWSLFEELWRDEATSRIGETFVAQPAVFALQVGLAEVWASWGIKPAAVVGHSIGEVAAAYVSGALTLEQAVRVIFQRSHSQQKASGRGKMLAVGLTLAEAEAVQRPYAGRVSVAAVNGPSSVALAGDPDALEEIQAALSAKNTFCRMLQVKVAFHSHHMDPLKDELIGALSGLRSAAPRVPMYSTVTAQPIAPGQLGPEYWWQNVREPVLFAPTVERLVEQGHRIFLELGPHPIHATAIDELMAQKSAKGLSLPSLVRKQRDTATLLSSLGALYVHGVEPSWQGVYPAPNERVRLPFYPWMRERHWIESDVSAKMRFPKLEHPLVGERLDAPDDPNRHVWQLRLDPLKLPWVDDHRVQGPIVYPAAAHLDMVLGCARSVFGGDEYALENVEFRRALFVFDDRPAPLVQVIITPERNFSIYSRQEKEKDWTLHVVGKLGMKASAAPPFTLAELRETCTRELVPEDLHARLRKGGLMLGPTFKALTGLWIRDGVSFARIDTPDSVLEESRRHHIHPGVLDSCITSNSVVMGLDPTADTKSLYLPVAVRKLTYFGKPGPRIYCCGYAGQSSDPQHVEGDLWVVNEDGSPVLVMEGFRGKSITSSVEDTQQVMQWLYDFRWEPAQLRSGAREDAAFLPPGERLAAAAEPLIAELRAWSVNQKYHAQAEPEMNRICVGYMTNAFRALGMDFQVGRRFGSEQLARELGVPEKLDKYFDRWLQLLQAHGILRRDGEQWELLREPEPCDTEKRLGMARAEHPEFLPEYKILQRCGEGQLRVLKGEVNPIEVIFPERDFESMEELYGSSFSGSKYNRIAKSVLQECLRALPADRQLRILEIGGGTAGVTSHLLAELPAERTSYVFTDIAQLFLTRARQRFAQFSFVDYATLDIEGDVEEQGFLAHSFDIVIASNVLHATEDLRRTLANVKRLLTSRGQLMIIEATAQPHWVDLSFGMTEGWWKFRDHDLRPSYPLLSEAGWRSFLPSVGFDDVWTCTDTKSVAESGNAVILARGPEVDLAPLQPQAPEGAWLVLDNELGLGRQFVAALGERAAGSVFVRKGAGFVQHGEDQLEVDPTSVDDVKRALEIVRARKSGCAGILHLWNADYSADQLSLETLQRAERDGAYSVVTAVRALEQTEWPLAPMLWICTRGAQALVAGREPVALPQVMSWGILRVLLSERSDQKAKVIDLDPASSLEQDVGQLHAEMLGAQTSEEEVLWRAGTRYVHRLRHLPPEEFKEQGSELVALKDSAVELVPSPEHALDQLRYVKRERAVLEAHEVELRVRGTGLNFRDIMLSLGLLSEGATFGGYYEDHIGVECAGVVSRVGTGVTSVKPGDQVVAFARGCFGSYVVAPEACVLRKPSALSEVQAAALPMAYLTAYYALVEVGGLMRGENVLIHAAAGGVGLAAVHIAKLLGATVYATAGRDSKRDYLRELGVEHVFDSRSLDFADAVRASAGEGGIDVVLNSLPGEHMALSLGLLGSGGRFVEIGKKDIYDNYKLGLRPFGNNLSYSAVDIDRLLLKAPARCRAVMQKVLAHIEAGELPALPVVEFESSQVESAFRYMVEAKQVGKIVVSYADDAVVAAQERRLGGELLSGDATYMVAGGYTGFGLRTAAWLSERGAKTIVLVGRRAQIDDENRPTIEQLRAKGVNLVLERADVSDEAQVVALLERMKALPRLAGIIQAAMVLDDGPLAQMSEEQFLRAVKPKVDGTWNLHHHTRALKLDHFVMYSSMSWNTGTPGQGNYAAANAFLEAFADYRRRQGLPALTINWGVIGDVGFVARNKLDTLSRLGWSAIPPDDALAVVETCLRLGLPHASVFGVDWARSAEVMPIISGSARFSHLIREESMRAEEGEGASGTLLEELMKLPSEAQHAHLVPVLAQQIARVFDLPPERMKIDVPLTDLGMDSLMAGQIRNWLARHVDIDFPTMGLMRGPTITQLTTEVLGMVHGTEIAAPDAMMDKPMMGMEKKSGWIHMTAGRSESASLRVFALPFVGGGASVFSPWPAYLPETVEVVGIQYPGRETRLHEPAIDDMSTLVEQLAEAMVPYLDRSFMIYGHSMGGLISYELALHLQEQYGEIAAKLIIGGWPSPALVEEYVRKLQGGEDLQNAPDERVLEVCRKNGLFAEEDVIDKTFVEKMMPSIRADLTLIGNYRFEQRPSLRCPIAVIRGADDPLFRVDQLKQWRSLTEGKFSLSTVPGGHLFIRGAPREAMRVIAEQLAADAFPRFTSMAVMSAE